VASDARERSREIVEALDLRVRSRDLIENQSNLLARVQARGKLYAFAYSKFEAVGIIVRVFLATKGEVLKGSSRRQYLVPRDSAHDVPHLSGIVSSGVNPTHQTAHAGAGDVVHGNVMLFQPGNDADVGESKSPATLESQAHRGTFSSCRG